MASSISTVRVINDSALVSSSRVKGGQRVKSSDILLNGQKIKIGGSFHDIARKLNRFKAKTGVVAEIHVNKGKERLVLKTNKNKVAIVDKNGILANYFSQNKIGKGADKLIEIVGLNKKYSPDFTYSRNAVKQIANSLTLNLSGKNIVFLSGGVYQADASDIIPVDLGGEDEVIDNVPDIVLEDDIVEPEVDIVELRRLAVIRMQQYQIQALNEILGHISTEVVMSLKENKSKIAETQELFVSGRITDLLRRAGNDEGFFHHNRAELISDISEKIYSNSSTFFGKLSKSNLNITSTHIEEAVAESLVGLR